MLLTRPKQKGVVFHSILKVTCKIYFTLTRIESGETNTTCKNCHVILKLKLKVLMVLSSFVHFSYVYMCIIEDAFTNIYVDTYLNCL